MPSVGQLGQLTFDTKGVLRCVLEAANEKNPCDRAVTREVLMDLLKVYGSNLEKELEGYELIIVD
jgi:hypothetical protein